MRRSESDPELAPALDPVLDFMRLLWSIEHGLQRLSKRMEAELGITGPQRLVLRVVGQRLTTTTQQATTSVFVQLELNGLARVGTSPLELLRRSVPGYLPANDPTLRDRDRRLDPLPEF